LAAVDHPWDLSPQAARALQRELAGRVVRQTDMGPVNTVAGLDVGYRDGLAWAAVVVLSYPELVVVDQALARRQVSFPYVPGLLSFREGPAVLDALARLASPPDLLIFDGHGLAHPRRFGLACHVGLWVDIPSIGCAKSRLVGVYEEPGPEQGSYSLLLDGDETIGAVVRTRAGVKPVFVSTGHRVDLLTAIRYVLACCRGYRLPETTRRAHRLAGK
jgi:deoxyribonuclease V